MQDDVADALAVADAIVEVNCELGITDSQVESLIKNLGYFELSNLKELSDVAAKSLSNYEGMFLLSGRRFCKKNEGEAFTVGCLANCLDAAE